jgi:hypothetical protein
MGLCTLVNSLFFPDKTKTIIFANVQDGGVTKVKNRKVMYSTANRLSKADMVFLCEIENEVYLEQLVENMNRFRLFNKYQYEISPESGEGNFDEYFAVIYKGFDVKFKEVKLEDIDIKRPSATFTMEFGHYRDANAADFTISHTRYSKSDNLKPTQREVRKIQDIPSKRPHIHLGDFNLPFLSDMGGKTKKLIGRTLEKAKQSKEYFFENRIIFPPDDYTTPTTIGKLRGSRFGGVLDRIILKSEEFDVTSFDVLTPTLNILEHLFVDSLDHVDNYLSWIDSFRRRLSNSISWYNFIRKKRVDLSDQQETAYFGEDSDHAFLETRVCAYHPPHMQKQLEMSPVKYQYKLKGNLIEESKRYIHETPERFIEAFRRIREKGRVLYHNNLGIKRSIQIRKKRFRKKILVNQMQYLNSPS